MEMSHANNVPSARSKIAPTKNCATSRSDNAITREGQELIGYLAGNVDRARRDETRWDAKRRGASWDD